MRTMIFDILERKIKEMKELRRLEGVKANKAQQDATDNKYRILVKQVDQYISVLDYLHGNLEFNLTDTASTELSTLLTELQDAVKTGYVDKAAVSEADTSFKNIQAAVKKDWSKHFSSITNTTTNTLRIISGIDAEKVSACLADIKTAETWVTDRAVFEKLKAALDNAEALIQSLSLDQEIITFLTSMTIGKASIADLNEKVLGWIRKESLESKIRLSFSNR